LGKSQLFQPFKAEKRKQQGAADSLYRITEKATLFQAYFLKFLVAF
jgi:hypothetical protein